MISSAGYDDVSFSVWNRSVWVVNPRGISRLLHGVGWAGSIMRGGVGCDGRIGLSRPAGFGYGGGSGDGGGMAKDAEEPELGCCVLDVDG